MPELPYTPKPYIDPQSGLVTYESDYFSGSQVQVMVGDVLIDNAVSVSFRSEQSRVPVYGYASPYFDFVAEGQVLIIGSLVVAFKEAGHLLFALQRYHNQGGGHVRFRKGESGAYDVPTGTADKLRAAAGKADPGRVRYRNIEQIKQAAQDGDQEAYHGLVTSLHALTDDEFEDAAEVFEDAIWSGSSKGSPTRDSLYSRNFLEDSGISYDELLRHRRADQYPPCDIWVTYGDMQAPDGVNHTVVKLLDVYFQGQSQVISSNGEPVYEEMPFLARNRV